MVEEAGSSFEENDGFEKPSGADVQGSSILVLQVSKMEPLLPEYAGLYASSLHTNTDMVSFVLNSPILRPQHLDPGYPFYLLLSAFTHFHLFHDDDF